MDANLLITLQNYGLSEKEARVYLTVLELGTSIASTIARCARPAAQPQGLSRLTESKRWRFWGGSVTGKTKSPQPWPWLPSKPRLRTLTLPWRSCSRSWRKVALVRPLHHGEPVALLRAREATSWPFRDSSAGTGFSAQGGGNGFQRGGEIPSRTFWRNDRTTGSTGRERRTGRAGRRHCHPG